VDECIARYIKLSITHEDPAKMFIVGIKGYG
jgi:hypothetical protein